MIHWGLLGWSNKRTGLEFYRYDEKIIPRHGSEWGELLAAEVGDSEGCPVVVVVLRPQRKQGDAHHDLGCDQGSVGAEAVTAPSSRPDTPALDSLAADLEAAREARRWEPDWSCSPGDTLRELIEMRGWTQAHLAREIGWSLKHVNRVVQGKETISVNFALALESLNFATAEFWMRREGDYRVALARLSAGKDDEAASEDPTAGLPTDLVSALRDPSVVVPSPPELCDAARSS